MRARSNRGGVAHATLIFCVLLGLGSWLPISAGATPVTYVFTGGSVDVTGTVGTSTLFSATGIPLTGTSVVFDAAGPTIDTFAIVGGPSGLIPMTAPYGGFDGFTLDALSLTPDTGYTNLSVTGGPTSFGFTIGPVLASGTATAYVGATPIMSIPFSETSPAMTGTLDIGSGTLTITAIQLLVISGIPGEPVPLVVKGDIVFTGMVTPEPAVALLLLVAAGFARARRSAS